MNVIALARVVGLGATVSVRLLSSIRAALWSPPRSLFAKPGGDFVLVVLALLSALTIRAALEGFGQFYYLPMLPAVILTAIFGSRRATVAAIGLSIAANIVLVTRENVADAAVNAALFASVSWLIANLCWRLRSSEMRTGQLSSRLAHRDAILDTILSAVPVVTLDREGHIRSFSQPARELLGADDRMAIGQPFNTIVESFDLDALSQRDAANEEAPEPVWRARGENGGHIPLSIQLGLMADDAGGDYAVLCLTDLTRAHVADARARDLHAQLNRVWRLNSLGEMAASLAHELNQPLSAATTYLHASQGDLQKAGLMGESASRTIELAKAQLLRAGGIIRRMRELLAHESRSLGVERVAAMVADMSGVLAMIERSGAVTIDVAVDDIDDRVRAERIQFQQAVLNLVRNAAEALEGTPDGRVRIVGRPVSDEHYELRIEDNGAGIPSGDLDTIIRPLMTTKAGGMGLGLSVTRTIVESHGGVLAIGRSELGGAAFSFSLLRDRELEDA